MKRMKKSVLACAACLVLIAVACIGWKSYAGAASGALLTVKEINYVDSTITLQSTNSDTVAYVSNSAAKKWEEAGTFGSDGTCVFDISWVSLSSNYVMTFKGDKSDGILKVTLPKQVTTFKVKYVPNADNPFTFTGDAGRIIEWRKNGVTEWKEWNTTTTNNQLAYLKENGATLYFRLKPVNGSATDAGKRASKEVSVKVSAKKVAPTVKVDASRFTVPLVAKMSYRVLDVDEKGNVQENNTAWTTVGGSKTYSLFELAPSAMFSGTVKTSDGTTKTVALQFKNNATASAQESRITTIIIPAQEIVTKEKDGISDLAYVSSKSLEIEVKAASNKEVTYEYCIVDEDNYTAGSLDYSRVTWTALANTKVTLSSTVAKEGSHIYVRRKAKGTPGDENFALASKELELTPANGVAYPAAITIDKLIELKATAGQIDGTTEERTLKFTATSPYANTTVKSIEFKDKYGGDIGNGTVSCTSECTEASSGNGYIITTKITSTAALDNNENAWNTPLKAYITLSNGEVIKTTDSNGVTLTLIPPTRVVNPTEAEKASYGKYYEQYTTDFNRIYKSNDSADKNVFKFILEFGSTGETTIQTIAYGDNNVNIVPMTYAITDGEKIDEKEETAYTEGARATVCYENTVKAGKAVRKVYVTIHVNDFENLVKETEVGKRLPFSITLTNGEVLSNHIYMTLVETATASQKRISFSQGSLRERETITDKNGNTSYSGALIDGYQIDIQFSDKLVNIPAVKDVTWNNSSDGQSYSIAGNSDGTGYAMSVGLQNAKLNKLPEGDGEIVITFKNGTSIKAGTISVTASAK